MEKKGFLKKGPPLETDVPEVLPQPSPFSGIAAKLFSILKLILGICLLPFVYAASFAFLKEISLVDNVFKDYFWFGVAAFLIIHLFVYELALVYRKGYRLIEIIFKFFAPLVKVAPYVLPIYSVVIFILYLSLSLFFKSSGLTDFFLFLFGFSLALHIVFSAKTVRSKQGDFLKANYIFGFSFIYIINVILAAACFSLSFKVFSFVNFFNTFTSAATNSFSAVFKQLFL